MSAIRPPERCHEGTIRFTIPGPAVGKGRPRFARRGKFVQTFTPEKTASYESLVKLAASEAMAGRQPLYGPVSLTVAIQVTPPASWSRKRRSLALGGEMAPTGKPDVSNVLKAIEDALNGIAYADDAQICRIAASKRYAETPGVTVWVRKALLPPVADTMARIEEVAA